MAVTVRGNPLLLPLHLNKLARGEGFASAADMFDWFANAKRLPYDGHIIGWFPPLRLQQPPPRRPRPPTPR
jgi:hypothetical protein